MSDPAHTRTITRTRSRPATVTGDAHVGALTLLAVFFLSVSASAQTFTSVDTPLPIPDNNPIGITSTITVPGGTGVITDVDATLNVNHTWVGDLDIELTSPGGTTIDLSDRPNVPETTFGHSHDLLGSYTFDDEAPTSFLVAAGSSNPVTPGAHQPEDPLNAFDGQTADGVWSLFVTDNAGGDLGTLNFWQLTFAPPMVPTEGQIYGTAAQSNVYHLNMQYRALRSQIGNVFQAGPPQDNFAFMLPTAVPSSLEEIQLASHTTVSEDAVVVRGQNCGCGDSGRCGERCGGAWQGWILGYGAGGYARGGAATGNLDYSLGGTQVGIYRWLNDGGLAGFFGSYGRQDVALTAGQATNIDSSNVGLFVRSGGRNNYLLTAASLGYDDFRSARTGGGATNRGKFHGYQGSVYVEKGWGRDYNGVRIVPSIAMQYVGLQQNDFTETGPSPITVGTIRTDSLRAVAGADLERHLKTNRRGGSVYLEARAHYMHEFLDTRSVAQGTIGGPWAAISGLDFGRNYAVIGTGLKAETRRGFILEATYDLQANNRQAFHTGIGSVSYLY